jgi:hypothetical protein
MNHFLVCENPECRFILDRRINGESLDGVRGILKKCPACGCDWSSSCPFCDQTLAVSFIAGLPRSACCGHQLRGEVKAA